MSSVRSPRTRYSDQSSRMCGRELPSTFVCGTAKRTSLALCAMKPTTTPAGKTA